MPIPLRMKQDLSLTVNATLLESVGDASAMNCTTSEDARKRCNDTTMGSGSGQGDAGDTGSGGSGQGDASDAGDTGSGGSGQGDAGDTGDGENDMATTEGDLEDNRGNNATTQFISAMFTPMTSTVSNPRTTVSNGDIAMGNGNILLVLILCLIFVLNSQ